MTWIRFASAFVAGASVMAGLPDWVSLILIMIACLVWGITAYCEGRLDGEIKEDT